MRLPIYAQRHLRLGTSYQGTDAQSLQRDGRLDSRDDKISSPFPDVWLFRW